MKFFKENPPKAFFWLGFIIVTVIVAGGMSYYAYLVSRVKPEVKKEQPVVRVGLDPEQVAAAKINSTTGGKITKLTSTEITILTNSGSKKFTYNGSLVLAKGESQVKGDINDLKVGMNISLGYNNTNNAAVNVSY